MQQHASFSWCLLHFFCIIFLFLFECRMCSLTIECVLFHSFLNADPRADAGAWKSLSWIHHAAGIVIETTKTLPGKSNFLPSTYLSQSVPSLEFTTLQAWLPRARVRAHKRVCVHWRWSGVCACASVYECVHLCTWSCMRAHTWLCVRASGHVRATVFVVAYACAYRTMRPSWQRAHVQAGFDKAMRELVESKSRLML